ncbi:hypothetical protein H6G76_31020 [Nostoc sp. FACHB-152]|uniref:hypothetical protein n=1 Tax=unclassified Nostoc TaxID=2593658 RepID=UPI0016885B48|nr:MULTISPECIES: hypothetical protein [unclassified Nostoc]MBD2451478.1 hypothetical protein [Nostoc sp. FACHB-152]MBD2472518.1 hypothetical protein [Nostoc sp. FACHB-145]
MSTNTVTKLVLTVPPLTEHPACVYLSTFSNVDAIAYLQLPCTLDRRNWHSLRLTFL